MIEHAVRFTLPTAMALLPAEMDSPEARALLLTIALQESRFMDRRQQNFGPALGFWQFEKSGIRNVSKHLASRTHLEAALRVLRYGDLIGQTSLLHGTVQDNDTVACIFARLLLYTLPGRLPRRTEPELAWRQYLDAWRPGKPHVDTWASLFTESWTRVEGEIII